MWRWLNSGWIGGIDRWRRRFGRNRRRWWCVSVFITNTCHSSTGKTIGTVTNDPSKFETDSTTGSRSHGGSTMVVSIETCFGNRRRSCRQTRIVHIKVNLPYRHGRNAFIGFDNGGLKLSIDGMIMIAVVVLGCRSMMNHGYSQEKEKHCCDSERGPPFCRHPCLVL